MVGTNNNGKLSLTTNGAVQPVPVKHFILVS